MFKTIKYLINNRNDKNYWKNKNSTTLYRGDTINRVPTINGKRELEMIASTTREDNYEAYITSLMSIFHKFFVKAILPVISLACIGGIIINFAFPIKHKKFEHYHQTTTEFDNDHVYKIEEEELLYKVGYTNETKVLQEGKYTIINSLTEDAISYDGELTLYVGEGANTYQIDFTIDGNQINCNNVSEIDYISLEQKEQQEPTSNEYKQLISTALDVFYQANSITEYDRVAVEEILLENEEAIKATLVEYEYIGKEKFKISGVNWGVLAIECIVLLVCILYIALDMKWIRTNEQDEQVTLTVLTAWKSTLKREENNRISWIDCLRNNNGAFCEAEKNRILAVQECLDQYMAEDKILTPFEKKLVKKYSNEEKK